MPTNFPPVAFQNHLVSNYKCFQRPFNHDSHKYDIDQTAEEEKSSGPIAASSTTTTID
jgi:hypothetical protein